MREFLNSMTSLPIFGVSVTILAYMFGKYVNQKLKTPVANSVLIADILLIALLVIFRIPYENYAVGGEMIELFLAPATAALAVKIYEQWKLLKENWLPVLAGCAVGSAVSMLSVLLMCRLFFLDDAVTRSLLPKSVTTAIAVPISQASGGIVSITVAALLFTGILGAAFSPLLLKLFRVHNKIAAGVAIGTSTHALGTTKALEIGDVEGAMSGIAIGVAGLITVIYSIFV